MARSLALALPLLAACVHAGPPRDLGEFAADRVPLEEAPALAHLSAALAPGAAATAADLFGEGLVFQSAPDPGDHMERVVASNAGRANEGPALSVLSYNVALLQANVFWVVPYAATPHLRERRPVLPDLVLEAGYDVLLLQEVWRRKDVRAFEEAATRHGYAIHVGPRGRYNDGLLTLVRASLLAEGTALTGSDASYDQRDGMENFPGPGIKRGYSAVVAELEGLGPVAFFNTHMQAWPDNWRMRMGEARQLGTALSQAASDLGPEAVVVLGGDLNGGPYYPRDTWILPGGEAHGGWWANTLSYALVQHYGALEDLYLLGRAPEEARLDITEGDAIPNLPDKALAEPAGDAAWCERTHGRFFTATDCTALYFEQYAGTEYPARMDHLLVHDPAGRVFVESADIVFAEDVRIEGLDPMPLSDHLGVAAHLRVAAPSSGP